MTVPETLPVLTGVLLTAPVPDALTEAALIGPAIVEVHEYVVPAIVDAGKKFNVSLLQICNEKSAAGFVIAGTGVTVTVTSRGSPGHPFARGVILYTTVPVETPSELAKTCPMKLPDPAAAPVTFVTLCMIHEKVVPLTLFGFETATEVDWPEQIP